MEDIVQILETDFGFKNIFRSSFRDQELDYDRFSHILRIGDIHYLFYSQFWSRFSLGIKHSAPKGLAGGGTKEWTTIMIPKKMNNKEDILLLLNGIIDFKIINLYNI